MSSFLCFICHSTVNEDTSEETREKYREVVGMNLCPDSQLCHICCHVLNKLSLFRSICLKRSLEYPVLFSEKGTINLQRSDTEILHIVCPDDTCDQYEGSHKAYNSKTYHFTYNSHEDYIPDDNYNDDHTQYVALEDNNTFNDYFNPVNPQYDDKLQTETVHNVQINDTGCNENEFDVNNDYLVKTDSNYRRDDFQRHDNMVNDETQTDVVENNDTNYDKNDANYDNNDSNYENNDNNYERNDINQENNEISHEDEYVEEESNIKEEFEHNNEYNETDNIDNLIETEADEPMDAEEVKIRGKRKKKVAKKILLTVEEQRAELEARRKEKKYIEAEFKCYNCALPFLFKDTYQAHMMRHEESNGEYKCPICTLRFASPAVLRSHSLVHSRRCGCGSTQRRCGCDTTLRPEQRAACHLCGNLLRDANGLQQHLRRVHSSKSSNRLHACNVCGESFPTHPTLRTHMIKHIKRKFPCELCPAVYSSPYTLAQHVKKHDTPPPDRVRCDCGEEYANRKSLLAHRRTSLRHHANLIECPICTKICPNQRSLELHMQAIHSNTKDHACPHCDARYSTRPSLLRHIASHTRKPQPKLAVCHLCGSSFKDKSKLNRHLKNVCEKAKLEEQLASLYE